MRPRGRPTVEHPKKHGPDFNTISVLVTRETREALDKLAKFNDRSMAAEGRLAIEKHLRDNEVHA